MENIYYVSYCMFFFNTYTDDNKCGSWDIDKIKLLFTFIYCSRVFLRTLNYKNLSVVGMPLYKFGTQARSG